VQCTWPQRSLPRSQTPAPNDPPAIQSDPSSRPVRMALASTSSTSWHTPIGLIAGSNSDFLTVTGHRSNCRCPQVWTERRINIHLNIPSRGGVQDCDSLHVALPGADKQDRLVGVLIIYIKKPLPLLSFSRIQDN
jgi:hypothetical protein